jgi:hypothetical protein
MMDSLGVAEAPAILEQMTSEGRGRPFMASRIHAARGRGTRSLKPDHQFAPFARPDDSASVIRNPIDDDD